MCALPIGTASFPSSNSTQDRKHRGKRASPAGPAPASTTVLFGALPAMPGLRPWLGRALRTLP